MSLILSILISYLQRRGKRNGGLVAVMLEKQQGIIFGETNFLSTFYQFVWCYNLRYFFVELTVSNFAKAIYLIWDNYSWQTLRLSHEEFKKTKTIFLIKRIMQIMAARRMTQHYFSCFFCWKEVYLTFHYSFAIKINHFHFIS